MYDGYGDEYMVNAEFTADMSGQIVKKFFDADDAFVEEKSVDIGVKAARKLFNVAVHNYDISFWDEDLCHDESYDPDIDDDFDFDDLDDDEPEDDSEAEQSNANGGNEPDNRIPAWSVGIIYKNGTEQNIKGYDGIPDPVMELFDEFDCYFEEEDLDGEFDEDDIDGGDESI
jgi:hypothetical protein